MEPLIQSSNLVLNTFKFTDMDLGDIPPEIFGIKVYDEHETRVDEVSVGVEVGFVALII